MAEEEGKILKRLEERYGYLPEQKQEQKELIDELLDWLKKKREESREKFKKVV